MIRKNLANFLTLGNLLCGCIGISYLKSPALAVQFIFLAAILDFFDGFVARLTGHASPIGKDLDSLADVVSFGVLPGLLSFQLIVDAGFVQLTAQQIIRHYLPYIAFSLPLAAAWRLARFNNDPEQSFFFKGLPAPAGGMAIAGLVMLKIHQPWWPIWQQSFLLCLIILLVSWFMISRIPMLSLKFKHYSFWGNEWRYAIIMMSLLMLMIFRWAAPLFIIIGFVIASLAASFFSKSAFYMEPPKEK